MYICCGEQRSLFSFSSANSSPKNIRKSQDDCTIVLSREIVVKNCYYQTTKKQFFSYSSFKKDELLFSMSYYLVCVSKKTFRVQDYEASLSSSAPIRRSDFNKIRQGFQQKKRNPLSNVPNLFFIQYLPGFFITGRFILKKSKVF